jgi:CheY-like chemotaxis protein
MKNILVVDDDAGIRNMLKKLIERSGDFRCELATGGLHAQELIAKKYNDGEKFDGIICDLWMPDMEGTEIIQNYLANPKYDSDILIIICTASTDAELWLQFIDAFKRRSIHFLVKPIEVANVKELLTKYF